MISSYCMSQGSHMIMEAENCHHLPSVSQRSRSQWYNSVWIWRLEKQRSGWLKSQSEGQRRRDEMSQLDETGRKQKGANFSFLWLLFHSGPPWSQWCQPTLGKAIYFTKSTNSNDDIIWKHFTDTPRYNVQTGYPMPVKLTHKIYHF